MYTFLKMGGHLERVNVMRLVSAKAEVPPGTEPVDEDAAGADDDVGDNATGLQRSFATFEARNAKCFKSEDRERLLGVIEAGFGVIDDFDLLVRHLLSR